MKNQMALSDLPESHQHRKESVLCIQWLDVFLLYQFALPTR